MNPNDRPLFYVFTFLLFCIFLFTLLDQANKFLGLQPREMAAWVQAIGSLVGISVAIAVPRSIALRAERRMDKEKLQKGTALAVRLSHDIHKLGRSIHAELMRSENALVSGEQGYAFSLIEVPAEILNSLNDHYLMAAEICDALQEGLYCVNGINAMIEFDELGSQTRAYEVDGDEFEQHRTFLRLALSAFERSLNMKQHLRPNWAK